MTKKPAPFPAVGINHLTAAVPVHPLSCRSLLGVSSAAPAASFVRGSPDCAHYVKAKPKGTAGRADFEAHFAHLKQYPDVTAEVWNWMWFAWQAGEANAQPKATLPEHADHVPEIAIRLRRLGRLAGVADCIPEDDFTAVGAIFTVLGMMANAMERAAAQAPSPAYPTVAQQVAFVSPTALEWLKSRQTQTNAFIETRLYLRENAEQGATEAVFTAPAVGTPLLARAKAEWHEDDGAVLWWAWNGESRGWAGEAAWIGTPLDQNWPGYHTHWTAHPAQPVVSDVPGDRAVRSATSEAPRVTRRAGPR